MGHKGKNRMWKLASIRLATDAEIPLDWVEPEPGPRHGRRCGGWRGRAMPMRYARARRGSAKNLAKQLGGVF